MPTSSAFLRAARTSSVSSPICLPAFLLLARLLDLLRHAAQSAPGAGNRHAEDLLRLVVQLRAEDDASDQPGSGGGHAGDDGGLRRAVRAIRPRGRRSAARRAAARRLAPRGAAARGSAARRSAAATTRYRSSCCDDALALLPRADALMLLLPFDGSCRAALAARRAALRGSIRWSSCSIRSSFCCSKSCAVFLIANLLWAICPSLSRMPPQSRLTPIERPKTHWVRVCNLCVQAPGLRGRERRTQGGHGIRRRRREARRRGDASGHLAPRLRAGSRGGRRGRLREARVGRSRDLAAPARSQRATTPASTRPRSTSALALDARARGAPQRPRAVGAAPARPRVRALRPRVPAEQAVVLAQERLQLAAVLAARVAVGPVDAAAVPRRASAPARRPRTRRAAGRAAGAPAPAWVSGPGLRPQISHLNTTATGMLEATRRSTPACAPAPSGRRELVRRLAVSSQVPSSRRATSPLA